MSSGLLDFADRVRRADGVDAFNERARLAMADGNAARVDVTVTDGEAIVAAAFAVGDAPVELAVDPLHRRRGHATGLVDRLLDAGEARFWAHGNLAAAQGLALNVGLTVGRSLLHLARSGPPPESTESPNIHVRTFRDEDRPALLRVNAQAFADHPEQGAMDDTQFERLTQQDWFDAAGLFVAERAGEIIGFHWTKRAGDRGEIYVLGVTPAAQSRGAGAALAIRGLRHLAEHGVQQVDLYVEADNAPALALYDALGFSEIARDVMYVRSEA